MPKRGPKAYKPKPGDCPDLCGHDVLCDLCTAGHGPIAPEFFRRNGVRACRACAEFYLARPIYRRHFLAQVTGEAQLAAFTWQNKRWHFPPTKPIYRNGPEGPVVDGYQLVPETEEEREERIALEKRRKREQTKQKALEIARSVRLASAPIRIFLGEPELTNEEKRAGALYAQYILRDPIPKKLFEEVVG